jgi:hypothetical protein
MPLYKRICPVTATQFHEKDYAEDQLRYPDVFDKAMLSEMWLNKSAADGRYYISRQAPPFGDFLTVQENDYIVGDDYGVTYIIPAHVFEMKYRKIEEKER